MESIMSAGKHRVFILESDPGMYRLLQDELWDEGYRVEGVADCREALEGLGAGAFDVVVADLEIPGRRSLEILEELLPWSGIDLDHHLPNSQGAQNWVVLNRPVLGEKR